VEQGVPETPVVLIVEEALLRIALADGLRDCGFLPLEARDADQAMEILETAPRITLVLTDIRMPGTIDGFGLAKWIRESRPGLPVLIASGYSGKFNIACELCADEQFFAKPYDVNHIATKMKGAVNARRNRDA
jgi:DNA-binding NtrC family response regulator